jgi:outer membrane protein assembly factor BamB
MIRPPLISAFILILGAGAAPAALTADWPEFRGPTGQGLARATQVPLKWDASTQVAWKVPVPGEGWSSPVLVDGRIYLTSAVGEATRPSLRALCLAAADGRILWDVEVFQADPGGAREMHQKNSQASPTPLVRDGVLYVHFGHMGTAALDLTGKIRWRQTALTYAPLHGNGGSPALVGDLLVINCDGSSDPFVAGLDARTGEVRWKTPRQTPARNKFSFSTPLAIEVDGATQIISAGSGFVAGYDPKDGREIWRVLYGAGFSVVPRPVFAHGLIFVSSSFMRPVVYAIKPQGAKGDVTATHVAWSHAKSAPNTPSLLVAGDELYFVSDGGVATCVDARTGTVHWSERLGGDFSASPVCAEGRVYFQNEEGVGSVVKAGKTFELLAKNDLGERTLASPAISDGAIFLRSKSHLWRIGN